MNESIFDKQLNKKGSFIIGIILVIIAILGEGVNYAYMHNTVKNAKPLSKVDFAEEYAYVDVQYQTDKYATYTVDDSSSEKHIYFVMDDKRAYSAILTKDYVKKLKKIYDYTYDSNEEAVAPKKVRVYGYTKSMPKDLKRLTAKSYNEIFKTDYFTVDNLDVYFKGIYLDTTDTPESNFYTFSILPAIVLIVGGFFLNNYRSSKKKMNDFMGKYAHEMTKINTEIASNTCVYVKEAKLYLTDHYIISMVGGFEIYKYSDVRWIYPYEYKYNGAIVNKSVYLVTNDSKVHSVGQIKYNKKTVIKFNELYEELCLRMPDVMHGYTPDNIAKNKELSKK